MIILRLSVILSILFIFLAIQIAGAAPFNDSCEKAFPILDVRDYCSSPRQFTTHDATASGILNPGCFPSFFTEPDNDVWFKFTASASSVNISVIGAIAGDPKGTLEYPQFALYEGSCSEGMEEVACISDAQGFHIVETFIYGLTLGETYYLRIDGRKGKTGSFQLCINNFNPVPSPSSDCGTAVVLCDKSPFTVPNVTGAGANRNEIPPGMCVREESSSAWYKWTCEESGSLTFTLKPVNPADDIDFVLFLLPNGVDDCSVKIPVRCMASGEEVGSVLTDWRRCSGTTGLRGTAYDMVEEPGCQPGDDNFIAALDMKAGASYALLVNNFHNTGNGFSITFGGTGTFKGPVAHFVVNKLKLPMDTDLWVRNKSSFEGRIKQWEWNFGVGAKPGSRVGEGPHKIRYESAGKKSISLSIETENGCQVTKVRHITITEPPPAPPSAQEPEEKTQPDMVTETAGSASEEEESKEEASTSGISAPANETASVATDAGGADLAERPSPAKERERDMAGPADRPGGVKSDTVLTVVTYDVRHRAIIYFQSDSSSLEADDIVILEEVYELMRDHPEQLAIIEGHTNNIPSTQYCDELATRRADSVINWLRGKGVAEERIIRKVLGKKLIKDREPKFQGRKFYQKAVVKLVERQ